MKKTHQHNVECIILAAGLSTRMGDWKLMLDYKGKTLLDHSIDNALQFCERIILVVGHKGELLEKRYRNNSAIFVVLNQHYHDGMLSSIQEGVKHISTPYFFITHGDLPCLSYPIFKDIWMQRQHKVVIPTYQQQRGHPVLFCASVIQLISCASKEETMKELITKQAHLFFATNYPQISQDIDTKEQYKVLINNG
ncbi:molybdenum cofactor cytidylyltransferase [Psychromonas marina]|uniref:Molybdenum cofactor cytidylyltransferase n=1 Tax=Psychromonas marina TaxID=88364 RepID=A0ABQ6E3D3_9GAMM|nr:NTP transferase domain-containing protein [Psychromonas marina]GLS91916.1 molybdenum cofactor cytidylyltransferase [Psychromonas marina]